MKVRTYKNENLCLEEGLFLICDFERMFLSCKTNKKIWQENIYKKKRRSKLVREVKQTEI